MPHGGFAGTLTGDVFGQPGKIKGRQTYHVNYGRGIYYVTGEDGWIVACSRKSPEVAQKEVNRLNRGGRVFYCTVAGHDLDWTGRPRELKKYLAKFKKRKKPDGR